MKTLIFCGGQGIRLREMNHFVPKAMVLIAGKPILWHVMKIYSKYGYRDFVLALGKGGELIRDYFFNYSRNTNDVVLHLGLSENSAQHLTTHQENEWTITFVDTGENAGTGARLFRCRKYLEDGDFMATYADCLSDVNLNDLVEFHNSHGKTATITGVLPPFRYGEFSLENNIPVSYSSVAKLSSSLGGVNGGFAVFKNNIFSYLNTFDECTMECENSIYERLTAVDQLRLFRHDGFWQCLDNDREYKYLNDLCLKNHPFWLL